MNGKVILHPVTVLDVIEESTDLDEDSSERADRGLWETKSPTMLSMMDKVIAEMHKQNIDMRPTYNRYHVALGTSGRNFCWFHSRKSPGTCHIEMRIEADARDATLSELQEAGVDATPRRAEYIIFNITTAGLEEHMAIVESVLQRAEEASR